jgi:hypothetical protein
MCNDCMSLILRQMHAHRQSKLVYALHICIHGSAYVMGMHAQGFC